MENGTAWMVPGPLSWTLSPGMGGSNTHLRYGYLCVLDGDTLKHLSPGSSEAIWG